MYSRLNRAALAGEGGLQLRQFVKVVDAEQPAVGHQDHALEGITRQQRLGHRQQRLGLGNVARVHVVRDGQALGGLHQRQHELARHQAGLAQAEGTHIVSDDRLTTDFHGGEVVEHNRQVFVDQRPHQRGKPAAECGAVLVEQVHCAQQMLVLRWPVGEAEVHGQCHSLEPTQHAQLAAGITQPVQDHASQAGQHVDLDARAAPRGSQVIKAERVPQLRQRPDIACAAAVDKAQAFERIGRGVQIACALKRADQRIDFTAGLKPTERANGALARLAGVIAERLHELRVAPRS